MKKAFVFIAVAAAMLAAGTAKAQLGVHFGYAPVMQSAETTSGDNTTTSTFNMDGYILGVTYNYAINKDLGVAFGLQGRYNTKKTTESDNYWGVVSGSGTYTYTQFLIDVPVLFNFSIDLGSRAKLLPFVGPTFSYALSGNTHVSTTNSVAFVGSSSSENDYPWYGDNSNNERLDISATLGLELRFSDFRVYGGYRMGLLDLNTKENVKTTTSGIFIGAGYAM